MPTSRRNTSTTAVPQGVTWNALVLVRVTHLCRVHPGPTAADNSP